MFSKSHISLRSLRSAPSLTSLRAFHQSAGRCDQPISSATGQKDVQSKTSAEKLPPDGQTLGLPEPSANGKDSVLDLSSGQGQVSLDHLGPIVINRDGSVGRVNNWGEMTEHEKKATLALLKKRNMLRKEDLTRDP